MKAPVRQLDQRFWALRPFADTRRPPKGWIRAVRNALGMTSAQFAHRLGIAQPSAIELEKSEAGRSITLRTLERAAEALGCRVVYVLIPEKPLEEVLRERATLVANKRLTAVEHTMRLEDQGVPGKKVRNDLQKKIVEELLQKPARLWDEI